MKKYKTIIIKSIVVTLFLAVFIWLLFYFFSKFDFSKEVLQEYIESKGALAPVIFIAITFLQVTIIPIPSTITVLIGTYIFGFWEAFFYSYIGMLLGSLFAFYLGRWFGRPFINWFVSDKKLVDKYLEKIKGKESVVLFFMFLFPFFPDDILCLIAGILSISSLSFFLMQLVTRAVAIIITQLMLGGVIIPYDSWGIPVIVIFSLIFIAIFLIVYKSSDDINDFILKKKAFFMKKRKKKS